MNRYFRDSYPNSTRKNLFPPKPKMAPPKPDLGTPPVTITSVQIKKRNHTEGLVSKSPGKRPLKCTKMLKKFLEAFGESDTISQELEESEEISDTDSEAATEQSTEESSSSGSEDSDNNTRGSSPLPQGPQKGKKKTTGKDAAPPPHNLRGPKWGRKTLGKKKLPPPNNLEGPKWGKKTLGKKWLPLPRGLRKIHWQRKRNHWGTLLPLPLATTWWPCRRGKQPTPGHLCGRECCRRLALHEGNYLPYTTLDLAGKDLSGDLLRAHRQMA